MNTRLRIRVQEIAQEQNVSLTKLHQLSEVPISMISRYWNNEVENVNLPALDKIAHALGVEPGDLLQRIEEKGGLPMQLSDEWEYMNLHYRAFGPLGEGFVSVTAINGVKLSKGRQEEFFQYISKLGEEGWEILQDTKIDGKWTIILRQQKPNSEKSIKSWEFKWLHYSDGRVTNVNRESIEPKDFIIYTNQLRSQGWDLAWQDGAYHKRFCVLKRLKSGNSS